MGIVDTIKKTFSNEVPENVDTPDETIDVPEEVENLGEQPVNIDTPDDIVLPEDIDLPYEGKEGQIEGVQDGDLIIKSYDTSDLLYLHDSETDAYKKNLLFNAIQAYKTGNNELKKAMEAYNTNK